MMQTHPPSVTYSKIMDSDEGVKEWTALIHRWGFCFVDECPATPEATEQLLERIAFIRHTHYGGFWDFTSDLSLKDTAYTSIALDAHTDNTYFTDPCGLQMFHILSHTEGEGGKSLLVDGYRAAGLLKKESPEAFNILSEYPVPAHASGNEGLSIQPAVGAAPVFRHLQHLSGVDGPSLQIRWNNSDRGTLDPSDPRIDEWYDAARKWVAILKRPDSEYWVQLGPGRPLIFDNWRILHGRSAFTGKRRMCGGYINMDDFVSRWKMTNFGADSVLANV